MFRPVFGCPLDVHLSVNDREIAQVIEECVLFLLENAMDIEVGSHAKHFDVTVCVCYKQK